METRRKPQLLVLLTLFILLFSQTLAWPLLKAPVLKNARHTEEILTGDYERLWGQFPAKRHVESFIGKRDSDNISEDNGRDKRQVGTALDDPETLRERQEALRKYLEYLREQRLLEDE